TPADWLLGVSSVRLTPFFLGTAIGIIPSVVLVVLLGASVGDWLFAEPFRWGGFLVAIVALSTLRRIRRRRSPASTAGA
ncbi:MAG: TVP38/TMEM64 family protein, partial [Acidimicrobiaceae bacterium]